MKNAYNDVRLSRIPDHTARDNRRPDGVTLQNHVLLESGNGAKNKFKATIFLFAT